MNNDEEYILIWEAPKVEKPEFRLYYDDKGKVVTYTCEKLEGNYVLVDAQTYAEGRPDVRVLDGKIIRISANAVVSKLVPNKEGQTCAAEDLSIVLTTKDKKIKKQNWKLKTYEL